ncbi:MAG: hypothetical protein HYV07_04080 [Deltaproteobacteria bacterium]|nr:hypothetical protein [Deltaproteobacteria bacterium]
MSTRALLELVVAGETYFAEAEGVRVAKAGSGAPLTHHLGMHPKCAGKWVLEVRRPGEPTSARLAGIESATFRLIDEDRIRRLPKLLPELGVPDWVGGVVEDSGRLVVWLDLARLVPKVADD